MLANYSYLTKNNKLFRDTALKDQVRESVACALTAQLAFYLHGAQTTGRGREDS